MFDKFLNQVVRYLFLSAFLVFLIGMWGRIMELFGWKYSFPFYSPGRLIEFSGILIIFVIALLLRQIRNEQRLKK